MALTELEQLKLEKLKREKSNRQQGSTTQATEEQFLGAGERLSGGFRSPEDLKQRREQQRTERGLTSGTPLEPTGFNLRNLADLPVDILDAIGPMFPVVGQIGAVAGGVAATGGLGAGATIALGGAGSAGGEFLRQAIGEGLGFDQGNIGSRAGRIALEGAFGATGEVAALGINAGLRATKFGLLKAANKIIEKRGVEGFTKVFGKIAPNVDALKTNFALESLKRGDKSVLQKAFADPGFTNKFARELFFGETAGKPQNIAKQIFELSHRPNAREPIKQLFKQFLGISDNAFETIFKKGTKVNQFNDPKTILSLGKKISSTLDNLFNETGGELGKARMALAKKAGAIDVSDMVTSLNTQLADELTSVGFLLKEGDGLFSVNPKFAGTQTGSAQAKMFGQLVDRFFGDTSGKVGGSITLSDKALLSKLVSGKKVFNVSNKLNFKDFVGKLKQIDVQISGNEFKSVGKLSPNLTTYLRGLRGVTKKVAGEIGDSQTIALTNSFEEFARMATPLRQGTKVKDVGQIETILKKFANPKATSATKESGEALDRFLQENLGFSFLDDLSSFNAAKELQAASNPFSQAKAQQSLDNIMKSALGKEQTGILERITATIDPVLPDSLKIGLNSNRHVTASALHNASISILRARFLAGSLGIAGFVGGGPAGGAVGLMSGFAIQNPRLFRRLVQLAAKQGGGQISQTAARQIPREAIVGGTQLIKSLLQRNEGR